MTANLKDILGIIRETSASKEEELRKEAALRAAGTLASKLLSTFGAKPTASTIRGIGGFMSNAANKSDGRIARGGNKLIEWGKTLGDKGKKWDDAYKSTMDTMRTAAQEPGATAANKWAYRGMRYAPGVMTGSAIASPTIDATFGEDSAMSKYVGNPLGVIGKPVDLMMRYANPVGLGLEGAVYGAGKVADKATQMGTDIGIQGAQMAGQQIGQQFADAPIWQRFGAAISPQSFQDKINQGIADQASVMRNGAIAPPQI